MRTLVGLALAVWVTACIDVDDALDTCRESGRCEAPGEGTDGGTDGGTLSDGGVASDGGTGEPLPQGAACAAPTDCQSSFCADGVCCDQACTGQCEACDLSGAAGFCRPVAGAPRGGRTACNGDTAPCAGSCDGVARDACQYPTVACAAASCTNGVATLAATCSQGTCPVQTQGCDAGICGLNACATVKHMAAGYDFTCAVLSDGTVSCWGANDNGQLGLSGADFDDRQKPVRLPAVRDAVQVAAGEGHACALIADGGVLCWGSNYYGQLGNARDAGTNSDYTEPQRAALSAPANDLSAGNFHTCAVTPVPASGGNDNIWCWGLNSNGQIGNGLSGGSTAQLLPARVCASGSGASCPAYTSNFTSIVAGQFSTCARLNGSSAIACWGSVNTSAIPAAISGITASRVGGGYQTFCGIRSDGTAACWGANGHGQGGTGAAGGSLGSPTNVCQQSPCVALGSVSRLFSNEQHSCALTGTEVRCWGSNNHGTIGNGSENPNYVANYVSVNNAVGITAGAYHNCAWLNDGTARCWGWNAYGQVGADSPAAELLSPIGVKW